MSAFLSPAAQSQLFIAALAILTSAMTVAASVTQGLAI